MFSTRGISRTLIASAYSLALCAVTCIALVAGDLSAQTISRGPYLQLGTPSSVIVRWRTDVSTTARVQYGNDAGNLSSIADSAGGTEHEVTLGGLAPDTRYYYSVGYGTTVLASGPDHKFVTSPPAGNSKPMRIWVIGDAGTGSSSQTSVRNAYATFNTRETDLWLVLGDNAYNSGTDAEYQDRHFAIYPDMLKSSVSWYTLGNHDALTGTGSHPYHAMFSLPMAHEAGGVSSGTENYYSFNYGNVHFISLDSQDSSRASGGAMANWLNSDLQANTLPWVIAFWHHPPYSKGSHDSDSESNLVQMRSVFLPILEAHGVDLVLSGHSHSYERSYLLDGHYGSSGTLTASMKKNAGSGQVGSPLGPYSKPSIGPAPHEGAVYVVAGSSGQTSGFQGTHPAMYVSLNNLGSLVLDLNGDTLDARFLRESGTVADTFTLVKGALSGNLPPDVSITSPTNNASYTSPPSLTLTADATDNVSVNQVAFYNGATPLGTSSSPYSVTWNNPPAGNHRLTARATDNAGATHISAPIFITVNAPATPPAAPSNLAAGTVTTTAVPLTWTDNATNETGFEIDRAIGAGTFSLLTTKGANSTSHTDTTVSPSTSYSYRVRAINGPLQSAYSNPPVTVTTPAAPPPPPPAAPSNLQKTTVTATQVGLKWSDKSTNETGFQLERAINGGTFSALTPTLPANTVSHTDATVAPLTRYNYRIRAFNAGGNSAYSSTLNVTTPDVPPNAPSGLSATAASKSQINLQWTDLSGNETGFEIERSTNGTTFSRIKTVGANVTTYINTNLTAGKTYWYRVNAKNGVGDSAYSNADSATTPLQ